MDSVAAAQALNRPPTLSRFSPERNVPAGWDTGTPLCHRHYEVAQQSVSVSVRGKALLFHRIYGPYRLTDLGGCPRPEGYVRAVECRRRFALILLSISKLRKLRKKCSSTGVYRLRGRLRTYGLRHRLWALRTGRQESWFANLESAFPGFDGMPEQVLFDNAWGRARETAAAAFSCGHAGAEPRAPLRLGPLAEGR